MQRQQARLLLISDIEVSVAFLKADGRLSGMMSGFDPNATL
ncbi:hypothetical protein X735_15205 [Mesorhizobium sp. L2C085B000]|nr:hypothetical protein X735_15205 [Mesorhizobium sp. L2C085B000]